MRGESSLPLAGSLQEVLRTRTTLHVRIGGQERTKSLSEAQRADGTDPMQDTRARYNSKDFGELKC